MAFAIGTIKKAKQSEWIGLKQITFEKILSETFIERIHCSTETLSIRCHMDRSRMRNVDKNRIEPRFKRRECRARERVEA